MKCQFCGYKFDEPKAMCSGCPMHSTCKSLCCPNCGYEIERESKLAEMAKRFFKRLRGSSQREA